MDYTVYGVILYGVKDNNKFYIMNTDPVLWTSSITESKLYKKVESAKYDILENYDNYTSVSNQLLKRSLDVFYVALINSDYNEIERAKLL